MPDLKCRSQQFLVRIRLREWKESTSQKTRPLEYTMASTAGTAAANSKGRKIRPKSRTSRAQSRTALAKLHAMPSSQSLQHDGQHPGIHSTTEVKLTHWRGEDAC